MAQLSRLSSEGLPADGKARLRAAALARRAAMGDEARRIASRRASAHAMGYLLEKAAEISGAEIALFAPFRDEIDTFPLAETLRLKRARLSLPVVMGRGEPLLFRRWEERAHLPPSGPFAIPTPGSGAEVVQPAIVLVPLAAFDRRGFRIGYGGGFYDRTLARLRTENDVLAIGYAFSCQEVEKVPQEPHDERVQAVVTDEAVHIFVG